MQTICSTANMKNEIHKRKLRNDVLFIAILLLVLAVAGGCLWLFRGDGNTVTVTVDGAVYGVYPLSQNRVEDIRTGESEINRLVIQDGKAYVETATCPDGICAGHRPISREGESIVCLPHKVVITVSTTDTDQPDIVV